MSTSYTIPCYVCKDRFNIKLEDSCTLERLNIYCNNCQAATTEAVQNRCKYCFKFWITYREKPEDSVYLTTKTCIYCYRTFNEDWSKKVPAERKANLWSLIFKLSSKSYPKNIWLPTKLCDSCNNESLWIRIETDGTYKEMCALHEA